MEKLIPLYVESDLNRRRNEAVAAHLVGCDRCNRLAREYRESQAWLRSYSAPNFDSPFFESLQRSVVREIESARSPRPIFRAIAKGWNRAPVLAAAMAVLLALGGLALYFGLRNVDGGSKLPHEAVVRQPVEVQQSPVGKQEPPRRKRGLKRAALPNIVRLDPQDSARMKFHNEAKADYPLETIIAYEPLPNVEEPADREFEPVQSPGDEGLRDLLRIDIQTSDPNVRIIWFAPKESDSHPTKSFDQTN